MAKRIKITFTGGDEIGDTVEREFETSLLVGRSHSADIRVREADVSGKHLEFGFRDGTFRARNLSRFPAKVDGRQLATGEEAEVKRHTVVELGATLRLRIDELDGQSPSAGHARETGATVAADAGVTQATRYQEPPEADRGTGATCLADEATFATRVAPATDSGVHVSIGSLGESATRDIDTMFDDAATVDDPPEPPPAPFDAGEPEARASVPSGGASSADGAAMFEEAGETGTGTGTGDGETQEMMTRVGSMDELLERRRQLERDVAVRHWRFGLVVVLALLALGGVWFAKSNRMHVEDAKGPFLENGEPDVASYDVVGESGAPDLFIEYPRDGRMRIVASANTNEVEIDSFIGQDRDVPFRCRFWRRRDRSELQLSLVASFERWMDRMAKEKGYSFERTRAGRAMEPEFFDDVFAGFCECNVQQGVQHGVTFVRAESVHTVGRVVWRGVCHMVRRGDLVYVISNEIPEMYWKRGGKRLWHEPFFGLYADFIRSHWDSPGESELLQGMGDDELAAKIGAALKIEAPGDFVNVERWVDTLLASTWGTGSAKAAEALRLRQKFLDAKRKFYDGCRLDFETWKANGDSKRMRSVFWDCQKVFGELKRDRRHALVNNPEVWECQQEQ